jgi:hypothetical protein
MQDLPGLPSSSRILSHQLFHKLSGGSVISVVHHVCNSSMGRTGFRERESGGLPFPKLRLAPEPAFGPVQYRRFFPQI